MKFIQVFYEIDAYQLANRNSALKVDIISKKSTQNTSNFLLYLLTSLGSVFLSRRLYSFSVVLHMNHAWFNTKDLTRDCPFSSPVCSLSTVTNSTQVSVPLMVLRLGQLDDDGENGLGWSDDQSYKCLGSLDDQSIKCFASFNDPS